MKEAFRKLEYIVDRLVPVALLVLLVILILEFFFRNIAEDYNLYIEITDIAIILVFAIDLVFKYLKMRNIPKFIRTYWLEIIAVLPFFLVFRALEGVARFFGLIEETAKESQQLVHAGVEISREFSKTGREVEEVAKLTRGERFARFLRPIARMPRLLMYTDKSAQKQIKKDVKTIEKDIEPFFNEPKDFNKTKVNKVEFKPVKFNIKLKKPVSSK